MTGGEPPFKLPPNYRKLANNDWRERKVPEYSDGEKRHWPGSPLYRPSSEEFYLCLLAEKWAERDGISLPGLSFYLDKLPDGYALFECDQPDGKQVYKRLFGHPSGRFYDSVLRFEPHFLWLVSGMEGECECIYCARKTHKPIIPRPRAIRDIIDKSLLHYGRRNSELKDDSSNPSSRSQSVAAGLATGRAQRNVRQAGKPFALDEEGSEDIYKECVRKLELAKGGKQGIEIDLTEEGSIDWKAERDSLPRYLTQIESQHAFLPRLGELVLWCPQFLHGHYLVKDPADEQYKYYSFEQKCFHGFPNWRGGVIAQVPSEVTTNGPVDFTDILEAPEKPTAFNTAGFRIETLPDPNDDLDKSLSKQYKHVPLRQIRPLSHWQLLLRGIKQKKLHPSILYALTLMTSISLLEKWRFNGDWPFGRIFCKGIYVGSELIVVGDTVRIMRAHSEDADSTAACTDVVVITSIRYNLVDIRTDHATATSSELCSRSYISVVGQAYTTNPQRAWSVPQFHSLAQHQTSQRADPQQLTREEVKSIFRPVGADEFGPWYPMHSPQQKYEISHEKILGRLYEADAIRLWAGQRQQSTSVPKPRLDLDLASILAGRRYATATNERLVEPSSKTDINWLLGDTRAQSLTIASMNGIDVGDYHDIRTPPTLRQWRMQMKIADGRDPGEVASEFVRDIPAEILGESTGGARRGRPVGSKLVDGKIVYPEQFRAENDDDEGGYQQKRQLKHSSQMAGAAIASGDEDEDEIEDNSGESESPEAETILESIERRPAAKRPSTQQVLSKSQIMGSTEAANLAIFDDDYTSEEDEFDWLNKPVPIRGGTEESEGGDYRE